MVSAEVAVACGLDETCGVKEAVSTTLYDVNAEGLDVTEADRMAVADCRGDKDAVKLVVLLGDGSLLADDDKTEAGEGVVV
jgi:hypothetical protein